MNGSILLTGATGFLGSNLLKKLIANNYDVIILKRSFSNTFRIRKFANKVKYYNVDQIKIKTVFDNQIEMIIHCATDYGRNEASLLSVIESNLVLPLNLLEFGRKKGVSYFVNTDTILDERINDYSLSKHQFKEWLKSRSLDVRCINIALEHFYGPFDNKSKFVSYIISNLLTGVPSLALTPGEQKRDFIFIDDVIDAFMKIISNADCLSKRFVNYEIGTGNPISIREIVQLIKLIVNNNTTILDFGAIPYRENEVMKSAANITEIRKLGWNPQFALEEGLRTTIMLEKRGMKAK
jgi:Nucleoside-diphosphate-sugar epimerases